MHGVLVLETLLFNHYFCRKQRMHLFPTNYLRPVLSHIVKFNGVSLFCPLCAFWLECEPCAMQVEQVLFV